MISTSYKHSEQESKLVTSPKGDMKKQQQTAANLLLSPKAKKSKVSFDKIPVTGDIWLHLKKDYKLVKFLGEGSFGLVKLG